jgi:hypothetical protein
MFHNAFLINHVLKLDETIQGLQCLLTGARAHLATLNYQVAQRLLDTALDYAIKHVVPDECPDYELEVRLVYLELLDQQGISPGAVLDPCQQAVTMGVTRGQLVSKLTELLPNPRDPRALRFKLSQAHDLVNRGQLLPALAGIEQCLSPELDPAARLEVEALAIHLLGQMGRTGDMLSRAQRVYAQWQSDGAPASTLKLGSVHAASYVAALDGVAALTKGDWRLFHERETAVLTSAASVGRFDLCQMAGLFAIARLVYLGCNHDTINCFLLFQRMVLSSRTVHATLQRWMHLIKWAITVNISVETGDTLLTTVCLDEMLTELQHEKHGLLFAMASRTCGVAGDGTRLKELLASTQANYGNDWRCEEQACCSTMAILMGQGRLLSKMMYT